MSFVTVVISTLSVKTSATGQMSHSTRSNYKQSSKAFDSLHFILYAVFFTAIRLNNTRHSKIYCWKVNALLLKCENLTIEKWRPCYWNMTILLLKSEGLIFDKWRTYYWKVNVILKSECHVLLLPWKVLLLKTKGFVTEKCRPCFWKMMNLILKSEDRTICTIEKSRHYYWKVNWMPYYWKVISKILLLKSEGLAFEKWGSYYWNVTALLLKSECLTVKKW